MDRMTLSTATLIVRGFPSGTPAVLASDPYGHVSAHDDAADGVGQHPAAVEFKSIFPLYMIAASPHDGGRCSQCPLDAFGRAGKCSLNGCRRKDEDLAAMRAEIRKAAFRQFQPDVLRAHGIDMLDEAVTEFHLIGGDRQNGHAARFDGVREDNACCGTTINLGLRSVSLTTGTIACGS